MKLTKLRKLLLPAPKVTPAKRRLGKYLTLLAFGLSGPMLAAQTPTFADWQSLDQVNSKVIGTIGEVTVTLAGPNLTPSDVFLDGSITRFSSADFTPPLATSDALQLRFVRAKQQYTFSFSAPIRDPIIHLSSHGSFLVLDTTNVTKLSGNPALSVERGVVSGNWDGTSNLSGQGEGSIRLNGIFSNVSFTAYYPFSSDGVLFQVGGVPVQGEILRITPARAIRIAFPTEPNRLYQAQYRPAVAVGQWLNLGTIIIGDGTETVSVRYDTGLPDDERFYRVLVVQ